MCKRVSVVQKTVKDPELTQMFNSMVGASDPDPNIVIPKYEKIWQKSLEVLELLEKFSGSALTKPFLELPIFAKGLEEILQFTANSRKELEELKLETNDNVLTGEDLKEINSDPEKMMQFLQNMNSKYKVAQLGKKYSALRESSVVKEMIMTARNFKNALLLEKQRARAEVHGLEKKEELSSGFILNSDGDYLQLFNFTSLDVKQLLLSDKSSKEFESYLLLAFFHIHNRTMGIVQLVTSPDIDVERFTELIIENIDEMRKYIPRCDLAFNKIKASARLLKKNFGEYYKDFVTSQSSNPSIIIENFISDVANTSTLEPQVTRQFRQIMNFYRQKASGNKVKDPGIKKMLDMIGQNLDILEENLSSKNNPPVEKKTP